MTAGGTMPAVGIGYRAAIDGWTRENLHRFDALEITVDHCLAGSRSLRAAIFDLVGRIPLTAHGVGLSLGTDAPLDLVYLDEVAEVVERLRAPAYSEHLAFTRVPGRETAALMPLPKTEAVAVSLIAKVRAVQSPVPFPFFVRNITYVVEWRGSQKSGAELIEVDCRVTAVGAAMANRHDVT